MNDAELLQRYVREGSEGAFTELVERHLNLVFAAALRQVGGDRGLAEDVTQMVFSDLARKAGELSRREVLAGWLYTSTRFAASHVVRGERRRQEREEKAIFMASSNDENPDWEHVQPVLDEAMHGLKAEDRNAIVLRFLEGKGLEEVGSALGVTNDAARMRIERALEKLKKLLGRRGVKTTAASLAILMGQQAVVAAPAGLGAAIAGTALAGVAEGVSAVGILELLFMSKAKLAIAAVLVAGASVPIVMQQQANVALKKSHTEATQQLAASEAKMAPLMEENARLSKALATVEEPRPGSNEVLRLRAEVSQLRAEKRATTNALAMGLPSLGDDALQDTLRTLGERAARLKARAKEMPEKRIPELALINEKDWLDAVARVSDLDADSGVRQALSNLRATAKSAFGSELKTATQKFADANNGMLPADISELLPYMPESTNPEMLQRYKFTKSGMLESVSRDQAMIEEIAPPVDDEYDTAFKFHRQGTNSRTVSQVQNQLMDAAIAYAKANNGTLPSNASELSPYLSKPVDPARAQRFIDEKPPGITLDQLIAGRR